MTVMTIEEKRTLFEALAILLQRALYPNLTDVTPFVDLEKDRKTFQKLVAHLNKLDDEQ